MSFYCRALRLCRPRRAMLCVRGRITLPLPMCALMHSLSQHQPNPTVAVAAYPCCFPPPAPVCRHNAWTHHHCTTRSQRLHVQRHHPHSRHHQVAQPCHTVRCASLHQRPPYAHRRQHYRHTSASQQYSLPHQHSSRHRTHAHKSSTHAHCTQPSAQHCASLPASVGCRAPSSHATSHRFSP